MGGGGGLNNSFKSMDMRINSGSISGYMRPSEAGPGANQGVQSSSAQVNQVARDNRESVSNFYKFEIGSNGNRMSIPLSTTEKALLANCGNPPSQRNSRGSNEFAPRIILSNSLKNSNIESNRQSGIIGNSIGGNDSKNFFMARNCRGGSYPEYLMNNFNMGGGHIINQEFVNNH